MPDLYVEADAESQDPEAFEVIAKEVLPALYETAAKWKEQGRRVLVRYWASLQRGETQIRHAVAEIRWDEREEEASHSEALKHGLVNYGHGWRFEGDDQNDPFLVMCHAIVDGERSDEREHISATDRVAERVRNIVAEAPSV